MSLQGRHHYLEPFQHYMRLRLGLRLPRSEVELSRMLEMRDVAMLYELWCGFATLGAVRQELGLPIRLVLLHQDRVEAAPDVVASKRQLSGQLSNDGLPMHYGILSSSHAPKVSVFGAIGQRGPRLHGDSRSQRLSTLQHCPHLNLKVVPSPDQAMFNDRGLSPPAQEWRTFSPKEWRSEEVRW